MGLENTIHLDNYLRFKDLMHFYLFHHDITLNLLKNDSHFLFLLYVTQQHAAECS